MLLMFSFSIWRLDRVGINYVSLEYVRNSHACFGHCQDFPIHSKKCRFVQRHRLEDLLTMHMRPDFETKKKKKKKSEERRRCLKASSINLWNMLWPWKGPREKYFWFLIVCKTTRGDLIPPPPSPPPSPPSSPPTTTSTASSPARPRPSPSPSSATAPATVPTTTTTVERAAARKLSSAAATALAWHPGQVEEPASLGVLSDHSLLARLGQHRLQLEEAGRGLPLGQRIADVGVTRSATILQPSDRRSDQRHRQPARWSLGGPAGSHSGCLSDHTAHILRPLFIPFPAVPRNQASREHVDYDCLGWRRRLYLDWL